MAKSAKIRIYERDLSFGSPATRSGLVAVVIGYASKGDMLTPTQLRSYTQFENTFGKTPENTPYSHMAIRRFFNFANELYFIRVGVEPNSEIPDEQDYKSTYSETNIDLYQKIGEPAKIVNSTITSSYFDSSPSPSEDPDTYLIENETYSSFYMLNDGIIRKFSFSVTEEMIDENGSEYLSIEEIVEALNEDSIPLGFKFVWNASISEMYIRTIEVGRGAYIKLIGSNTTRDLWNVLGFHSTNNETSSAEGVDPQSGDIWIDDVTPLVSPNLQANITFKQPGTDGDRYRLRFSSTNSPYQKGDKIYKVDLLDGPDPITNVIETFENIEFNYTDPDTGGENNNFWIKKINGESDYISASIANIDDYVAQSPTDDNIFFVIQNNDNDNIFYQLDGGSDGVPVNDNETIDTSDDFIDADINNRLFRNAIDLVRDKDLYDYDFIVCPGQTSNAIVSKLIQMCESRGDIFFLQDTPLGLDYADAIKWHNGDLTSDDMLINTSYCAVYSSWQQDYDEDNAETIWVPPSVYIIELFAKMFNQYKAWSIPAGVRRGVLNSLGYEYSPDEEERDFMLDDSVFNSVNPICRLPGYGIVVWGDVTTLRGNSSLRDINVRIAVNILRKRLRKSLFNFTFEANDAQTRQSAKERVDAILDKMVNEGAFYNAESSLNEDPELINQQRIEITVSVEAVRGIKEIVGYINIKRYGSTVS